MYIYNSIIILNILLNDIEIGKSYIKRNITKT